MKMLAEDIRNQKFHSVYLLYGEEVYLRNQYRDRLREALADPEDTMNVSRFEGKNINPREIIDLAETLPFFADRRLILIEDSGFFKNKCDELADYLPELPDSTCILFIETEVDKRSRMYKALTKKGRAVEFQTQDTRTLMKWILGMLKKEGKQISERAMNMFLACTGTDMENIYQELQKLLSYTEGRETITEQDIEAICTVQTTGQIFEMVRALAEKDQQRVLSLYYDLLALREPPMRILFLIARQFQQLLLVKSLANRGMDKNRVAKEAGLQPFIAGRLLGQARAFTQQQLQTALQDCVQAEEDVKTGKIADVLSVELLLMRYSH